MVSVAEAKRSVVLMFVGLVCITIWLPMIVKTEVNNKSNRIELKNLEQGVKKVEDKFKEGLLKSQVQVTETTESFTTVDVTTTAVDVTTTGVSVEDANKNSNFNIPEYSKEGYPSIKKGMKKIARSDYIFVRQSIQKFIKQIDPKTKKSYYKQLNKPEINYFGDDEINVEFGSTVAEIKDYLNINDENLKNLLNHLSTENKNLRNEVVGVDNNPNVKIVHMYFTIEKDFVVTDITELLEERENNNYGSEFEFKLYHLEPGTKDEVIELIKKRRRSSNTVQKWLGRLLTFLLLAGGLQMLIEPIRVVIEGSSTIIAETPILKLISPFVSVFGQLILGLYKVISIGASILLTFVFTLIVYFLVNNPIISLILMGGVVGLGVFMKKK